jgi:nickel/cobalt exporter
MKPVLRLGIVLAVLGCLMLVAAPRPASAHPMGNFTINQYSALTIGQEQIDVMYVIDMAEIPAFQELGTIRPDHGPNLSAAERDAYASRKSSELLQGLSLTLDGKPLILSANKTVLSFPTGAGGLSTLRLEMYITASTGGVKRGAIEYKDSNYAERIGWREVIAQAGDGEHLEQSSVPSANLSNALRSYPTDLLNSPPNVTSASVQFVPGASPASSGYQSTQVEQSGLGGAVAWAQQRADALTELIGQKDLPLGALLLGLLVAFGMGAAHALSPGHGKTVVAAYLVGSRGTAAHAIILGVTVTLSHTLGVFLLGFVVLYASNYIVPEELYPWLGFASGFLITIVGVVLFAQRLRAWKRTRGPDLGKQPAAQHDHDHDHIHDHHGELDVSHSHGPLSREHTHLPADGQKVTLGSLLALGITGGIIPCPSALVVLLVAMASHRVDLGLLLILAFSLGLAFVLTGIGLVMVLGRNFVTRANITRSLMFSRGLAARLPMFSALAVSCLGLLIAFQSINAR